MSSSPPQSHPQTSPPNPFLDPSPSSSSPPPPEKRSPAAQTQEYTHFRATGTSIELEPPKPHDHHHSNGGGLGPLNTLRQRIPGKRTWSTIRLLLRILSLLLSILTGVLISLVLNTYLNTRHSRYSSELLWPKHPQLVPTIYMLAAACITTLVHVILIVSHCYDRERYLTEAYTKRDRISTIVQLWLGLVWLVGGMLAGLYKREKYGDGNDLWSWSCMDAWHGGAGAGARGDVGGWKWATVCAFLRAAYGSAYLNATLEYLSVLTFTINTCLARGKGYQAAPAAPAH